MEWTYLVLSNQRLGSAEAIYMANAEMFDYTEFRC